MNYLRTARKVMKLAYKSKMLKKNITFILGTTLGGMVTLLIIKKHYNMMETPSDNLSIDTSAKRNEIKETFEKLEEDDIGDVGIAFEKALGDVISKK